MPEQDHQKIVRARTIEAEVVASRMEDEAIGEMLEIYDRAINTAFSTPASKRSGTWTRNRQLALVNQLEKEAAVYTEKIAEPIKESTRESGQYTVEQMEAILSWDGKTQINTLGQSAASIQAIVDNSKIGKYKLDEWFSDSFTEGWDEVKKEIAAGSLLGESGQKIAGRIRDITGSKKNRDTFINVARTWHAETNSRARDIVYNNNKDIIKGVEWSAVLERPSSVGRGTCKRCQALDGQQWALDEPQPPNPLHPLCRCVKVPVTLSWKELGLNVKEMQKEYRNWIDYDAEYISKTGKNFKEIWWKLPRAAQDIAVGPTRGKLIRGRRIKFEDMVDRITGEELIIVELNALIKNRKANK